MVMVDHGLAHLGSEAVQDVEHAVGQPDFLGPRAEEVGGHGRDLAGLGHDAIATRQRRGNLPREEVEGQVPRADAADHAQGLPQGVVDRPVSHGVALAGELLGGGSIEAQVLFGARNVHGGGEGDRLAVVPGLGLGEEGGVLGHLVGEAVQDGPAVGRGPGAPRGEGRARRSHSGLDIVRTRPGNPPIDRSGRRFDIVKPLPAQRGLKHSIDQIQDVVFHRPTRWHGKEKTGHPRAGLRAVALTLVWYFVVSPLGLEPRMTEPKSVVLPLHHGEFREESARN